MYKKLACVFACACLLVSVGCGGNNQKATITQNQVYLQLTDDAGRKIVLPKKPERIVALSPSYLEPIDAIGGQIVGRPTAKRSSVPKNMEKLPEVGHTFNVNMKHRLLSTLSGGERQRAWIAMALAQNPEVLFLDEPTTYLDICHQLEIMQLLERLNKELGLTVVMVLHDLNHTLQYTNHVIVIKQGELVCEGNPKDVVDKELLRKVYSVLADEFACSNGLRALLPVDLIKQ